jgi:hypothetical protein
LSKDGFSDRIHKTIIADERNPDSEGMVLSRKLDVKFAPFFLVQETPTSKEPKVVTMYFQLKKDYLTKVSDDVEEMKEIAKSGAADFL